MRLPTLRWPRRGADDTVAKPAEAEVDGWRAALTRLSPADGAALVMVDGGQLLADFAATAQQRGAPPGAWEGLRALATAAAPAVLEVPGGIGALHRVAVALKMPALAREAGAKHPAIAAASAEGLRWVHTRIAPRMGLAAAGAATVARAAAGRPAPSRQDAEREAAAANVARLAQLLRSRPAGELGLQLVLEGHLETFDYLGTVANKAPLGALDALLGRGLIGPEVYQRYFVAADHVAVDTPLPPTIVAWAGTFDSGPALLQAAQLPPRHAPDGLRGRYAARLLAAMAMAAPARAAAAAARAQSAAAAEAAAAGEAAAAAATARPLKTAARLLLAGAGGQVARLAGQRRLPSMAPRPRPRPPLDMAHHPQCLCCYEPLATPLVASPPARLRGCEHPASFDLGCLQQTLQHGATQCPHPGCDVPVGPEDMLALGLPAESADARARAIVAAYTDQLDDWLPCPTLGCIDGMEVPRGFGHLEHRFSCALCPISGVLLQHATDTDHGALPQLVAGLRPTGSPGAPAQPVRECFHCGRAVQRAEGCTFMVCGSDTHGDRSTGDRGCGGDYDFNAGRPEGQYRGLRHDLAQAYVPGRRHSAMWRAGLYEGLTPGQSIEPAALQQAVLRNAWRLGLLPQGKRFSGWG